MNSAEKAVRECERTLIELQRELDSASGTVTDMLSCLRDGRPIAHDYVRSALERVQRCYTEYAYGLGATEVYRKMEVIADMFEQRLEGGDT